MLLFGGLSMAAHVASCSARTDPALLHLVIWFLSIPHRSAYLSKLASHLLTRLASSGLLAVVTSARSTRGRSAMFVSGNVRWSGNAAVALPAIGAEL